MIGLYILIGLVILAAAASVESRNLLFSVIAFGLAGLGCCLTYLFMGSWDLAIIQLGIEIFLLFYLIRSTHMVGEPETYPGRQLTAYLGTFVFAVIVIGFAYVIFITLPETVAGLRWVDLPSLYELIGIAAVLFAALIGWRTVLREDH